jgi:hypothetical protein
MVLSLIFHFCGFKDKLMILKYNIAALFDSLFCQRLGLFVYYLLRANSYCFLFYAIQESNCVA